MEQSLLPLVAPFALIAASIVSPLMGKNAKAIAAVVSAFFIVGLASNTWLLLSLGGDAVFYPTADGLLVNSASAFIVEVALFLGLLAAVYSAQYFEDRSMINIYFSLFSIFMASLVLMAVSFNILIIYVAFEASTISGGILILFTRRKTATKAAVRFFIMSVIGALTILVGILYQNSLTGSFLVLQENLAGIGAAEAVILAAVYAIGFGIKVGVFPFGLLWLPAAHSEAPTPISAILSGVMVQIAAFAVIRVVGALAPADPSLAYLLVGLGALSVIVGAALAAVEAAAGSRYSRFAVSRLNIRGIKRIWAFSTSSEVGVFYVLLGMALAVPDLATVFLMGILLHFLNHGLAKALLFFDSGFAIEKSHVADLSVMKGIGARMGPNAVSYLIGGFSLSLVPGTLGITTLREFTSGNVSPAITATVLAAAAFIFFSTLYSLRGIIAGKPKVKVEYIGGHERDLSLLRVPGLVLALCILGMGVVMTLGGFDIAFAGYFVRIEEWFHMAAEGIVLPAALGGH